MSQNSTPKLPLPEFIAMMAMIVAIIAFAIDAMLPAMPQIAAELSPEDPNKAQLILTSFALGMGLGTFVVGPLSDAYGRLPIMLGGALLYIVGAGLAWMAPSLETVLLGRVLQGVGAAGPRIVSMALTRDLYAGRQMARIMSFVMMVFMIVPAMAPLIGSVIIELAGWRSLFGAFIIFVSLAMAWVLIRQPETLPREARRPFRVGPLLAGAKQVLGLRVAQLSIGIQSMLYAGLFGTLSQIQPIFDKVYDRNDSFPIWFTMIALVSGAASLLNAQLVERLGMRKLVRYALGGQLIVSGVAAALIGFGIVPPEQSFPVFLVWITVVFSSNGFTMGNINAMAMEPLGHIAGMAASIIAALATVIGVLLAIPLGLAFDGTILPLSVGITLLSTLALGLMVPMPSGPPRK